MHIVTLAPRGHPDRFPVPDEGTLHFSFAGSKFYAAQTDLVSSNALLFHSHKTDMCQSNGLEHNEDIAAKPIGINHINDPFLFVQSGSIHGKLKQEKHGLIYIKYS